METRGNKRVPKWGSALVRLDPYQEEEEMCGADARRWEIEDILSYGFSEMSWEQ